jgi:hypothetical protein
MPIRIDLRQLLEAFAKLLSERTQARGLIPLDQFGWREFWLPPHSAKDTFMDSRGVASI